MRKNDYIANIFLTVIMLITVFLISFFTIFASNRAFEKKQIETTNQQVAIISQQLHEQADSSSMNDLLKSLQAAGELIHFNRIGLYQANGVKVYDSQAVPNKEETPSEVSHVINTNGDLMSRTEIVNGVSSLHYTFPIRNQTNEIVAVTKIQHDLEQQSPNQIWAILQWPLLLLVLVNGVLSYLIFRSYINKPLQKLEVQTQSALDDKYGMSYRDTGFGLVDKVGQNVNEIVTKLANNNQELVTKTQQYDQLIDNITIGIMIINNDRKLEVINPTLVEQFGDKEAIVGHYYVEFCRSYGLVHLIEESFEKGVSKSEEINFYYPAIKIYMADVVPIYANEATPQKVLVLLRDMTDLRRLEQVRTDFIANASHELRTPVTAIQGFAETLVEGAIDDPVLSKEFTGIILKESQRLTRLIKDILDLSKFEKGNIRTDLAIFDVGDSVNDCFSSVSLQAEAKNVSLTLNMPRKIRFYGDRGRMEQIISNLINNAVNYTDNGGSVIVTVNNIDQNLVIIVSDDGIGIPDNEIDRVFERFYRVDKARSRNSGGTGLGLAIVRNLVHYFNGTIEVKSRLGLGTSFIVKIPNI